MACVTTCRGECETSLHARVSLSVYSYYHAVLLLLLQFLLSSLNPTMILMIIVVVMIITITLYEYSYYPDSRRCDPKQLHLKSSSSAGTSRTERIPPLLGLCSAVF